MNILIVDDSVIFRSAISKSLQDVSEISYIKTANNGKIAVEILKSHTKSFDLVILDMEMPVMDGMETIHKIREFNKDIPIIIFSSITLNSAEKTISALNKGANDFITKIEGSGDINEAINMIGEQLTPKIQAFAKKHISKSSSSLNSIDDNINDKIKSPKYEYFKIKSERVVTPELICIGSSTGGPEALSKIFKNIKHEVNIPILLVQHMPPIFTAKLAHMLNELSPVNVVEAKDNTKIKANTCYIAPGNFHMEIESKNNQLFITLNQKEKNCHVRPSVNILFSSIANNFKGRVMSIVLTGMGEDGKTGAIDLQNISNDLYIQDQESSVVWGMPGSIFNSGQPCKVLSIEEVPRLINTVAKQMKSRG